MVIRRISIRSFHAKNEQEETALHLVAGEARKSTPGLRKGGRHGGAGAVSSSMVQILITIITIIPIIQFVMASTAGPDYLNLSLLSLFLKFLASELAGTNEARQNIEELFNHSLRLRRVPNSIYGSGRPAAMIEPFIASFLDNRLQLGKHANILLYRHLQDLVYSFSVYTSHHPDTTSSQIFMSDSR
jgi:hypothetical protein